MIYSYRAQASGPPAAGAGRRRRNCHRGGSAVGPSPRVMPHNNFVDLVDDDQEKSASAYKSIRSGNKIISYNATTVSTGIAKRSSEKIIDLRITVEDIVDLTDRKSATKVESLTSNDDDEIKLIEELNFSQRGKRRRTKMYGGPSELVDSHSKDCPKKQIVDLLEPEAEEFLQILTPNTSQFQSLEFKIKATCPAIDLLKIEKINDPRRKKKFEAHRFFLTESKVSACYSSTACRHSHCITVAGGPKREAAFPWRLG